VASIAVRIKWTADRIGQVPPKLHLSELELCGPHKVECGCNEVNAVHTKYSTAALPGYLNCIFSELELCGPHKMVCGRTNPVRLSLALLLVLVHVSLLFELVFDKLSPC